MTKFKYPYTQRNLFEEPERYFYAQCDNKDFYSSWLTSRYASLQLLNDIPSKINSHLAYSSAFLTGMMSDIGEQMDDREIAETALEPLVKKFEIFRRFFTQYDDDFRRTDDAKPLGVAGYIQFGELLAEFVERYGSNKHASIFLKLMDAICSANFLEFDTVSVKKCVSLIKREIAIVENIL